MGLLNTGGTAGAKELFQSLVFKALYHASNSSRLLTIVQQLIHRVVHATNALETQSCSLRKIFKGRGAFPNEEAGMMGVPEMMGVPDLGGKMMGVLDWGELWSNVLTPWWGDWGGEMMGVLD